MLLRVLYIFWILDSYETRMIWKYLLYAIGYLFILFITFFKAKKFFFYVDEVQFIYFSLCCFYLGVISRKPGSDLRSRRFIPLNYSFSISIYIFDPLWVDSLLLFLVLFLACNFIKMVNLMFTSNNIITCVSSGSVDPVFGHGSYFLMCLTIYNSEPHTGSKKGWEIH